MNWVSLTGRGTPGPGWATASVKFSTGPSILPHPHFIMPDLQKPIIFDIRTRHCEFNSFSGSNDMQMVNLTLRVLARPDEENLCQIYSRLGVEYATKVLPSIGNEVMKVVVAQFNADRLLTERPQVSTLVRLSLIQRAKEFNILLDDVAITHLSYKPEFSRVVEQKQVAQQEVERSKFVIVKAEGESEAAKLISEATAVAGNGLTELRMIEAAREIAGTLAKNPNVTYVPNAGNILLGMSR